MATMIHTVSKNEIKTVLKSKLTTFWQIFNRKYIKLGDISIFIRQHKVALPIFV